MDMDKKWITAKAKEQGFVRDTLEKVLRLKEILLFINENPLTRDCLALKGGTAINLTVFDLPRLSVDIDLDYSKGNTRAEMERERTDIIETLDKYMASQGYDKLPKSKSRHTLETLVYGYRNAGGASDNIKVEINFSMRSHIYPLVRRKLKAKDIFEGGDVLTLETVELFASKIKALLDRGAPRDLYDVDNMVRSSLFEGEEEMERLRKCTVFYMAVGNREVPTSIDLSPIEMITPYMIKLDLLPMKRKDEEFDLAKAKERIKNFISKAIFIGEGEKAFLEAFRNGKYRPEFLFEDEEILSRIKNHPMALWKIGQVRKG